MAGNLTVTLRRSPIGEKPKTRLVIAGLGLGKMNSARVLPDNPSTRGAIHKVRHLVEVTEESDQGSEVRDQKPASKAVKKAPAKKAPAKKTAKKSPAKKAPAKKATGK